MNDDPICFQRLLLAPSVSLASLVSLASFVPLLLASSGLGWMLLAPYVLMSILGHSEELLLLVSF